MAKLFVSKQIRQIDSYTIENEPVSSVNLMERAARALFDWIQQKFLKNTQFLFIVGPGNNGGDGWALARILFHHGYENIRFYVISSEKGISPDSEVNRRRLSEETDIKIYEIEKENQFPYISRDDWVIDALFGSGLSRPLDGISLSLVEYINQSTKAGVISIDIPSGLFGEDNTQNKQDGIIRATYTLSFQFPKLAFFFAENHKFAGKWNILPIGLHQGGIKDEPTAYEYSTLPDIKAFIKPRDKFSHKGTYGHALLIAGSYGMMGAAVLAAKAAVRSGAGLVTAHIPRLGYNIIQTAVPEAIVSIDDSDLMFSGISSLEKYTAVAIGPGINTKTNTKRGIQAIIEKVKVPLVIDADGLNILSENKDWLDNLPENTIITPHPKEFDRLTQAHSTHFERFGSVVKFAKKHKITVVLKGANTCICNKRGEAWFNTTGNPGMAKGGSGDVLTGIIVSLLAQGYCSEEAAKIGVFVHGLAGDISRKKLGYHAVIPSDIIDKLGYAFKKTE